MRRNRYGPILSGIDSSARITLTPEQEAIREQLQQEEREEHRRYMAEEAQERAEQISFILDQVQDHPIIQKIIGLKFEGTHEKYARIAFGILLENDPKIAAVDLAVRAKQYGFAMADAMSS
jgi:hypothetical protein